jgi:dUTPase
MPSTPPVIITNSGIYTNPQLPTQTLTGALLYPPLTAGLVAGTVSAGGTYVWDMGVKLTIPEGYIVAVTEAAGLTNSFESQGNLASLSIPPTIYTNQSIGSNDLKITIINNGASSNLITNTTQVVQLTYIKVTTPNVLITSS